MTQSTPFNDFQVSLSEAHKTGLGSSAALVVAFTAAVLSHYIPETVGSLSDEASRARLHNLAQIAHCTAQGKIGSGFDVAAAVYGSCVYRRFSPSVLEGLGEIRSASFATRLRNLVEQQGTAPRWDHEIASQAVKLSQHARLVMCDVDCGSQTVGMVKQVLAWRSQNQTHADQLWERLQQQNEEVQEAMINFNDVYDRNAGKHEACLDSIRQGEEPSEECYDRLKVALQESRRSVQDMSSQSNVPIEPPPQTKLLDACCAIPGVLGGVVPGAGGYDAIALLVLDDDLVLHPLSEVLKTWKFGDTSPSRETAGQVRALRVREEMHGAKKESGGSERHGPWLR